MSKKPQGVILYKGPSLLNGKQIVAVATNLTRASKNPKTGKLIQTYILGDHGFNPMEARRNGTDDAVCGDCPHRNGSCYVNIVQGPLAVYRAVKDGKLYKRWNKRKHLKLFRERVIRIGSYGDPVAVPIKIWRTLSEVVKHWTGYTHQWRTCDPEWSTLLMASCDTSRQREQAQSMGWRTFRIRIGDEPLLPGEFSCPASQEEGKRLTCLQCKACSGERASQRASTPAIIFHGSRVANKWSTRQFEKSRVLMDAAENSGRIELKLV